MKMANTINLIHKAIKWFRRMGSLLLWIGRIRITIGRRVRDMIRGGLRLGLMDKARSSFLISMDLGLCRINMGKLDCLISMVIK
jgi:hypothetical protein